MNYRMIKKVHPIWLSGFVISFLFSVYWMFVATDKYSSTSSFIVQTAETNSPDLSLASMMSGSASQNKGDLLLLTEYLTSIDTVEKLDAKFRLIEAYSDDDIDYWSRYKGDKKAFHVFYEYFLDNMNVVIDDYTGVLKITVDSFKPKLSHDIAHFLLSLGEEKMNEMNKELADEQVVFIEKQVERLSEQVKMQRNAVIDYQNKNNLLSPLSEIESNEKIILSLKEELIKLKAKKDSLISYMSSSSSTVKSLNREIRATSEQLTKLKSELTGIKNKKALNEMTSEYQEIAEKLSSLEEIYSNALTSLEKVRTDAARSVKKIAIIQSPTDSSYPVKPERTKMISSSFIVIMLITWLFYMFYSAFIDRRKD